jgi:hypothetical protein
VDNDSQGFRDNYRNIYLALDSANNEITDLQTNLVRLNQDNDFGQSLVKQAQFQDCSVSVYDKTAVNITGDVTLDYKNGSYQKISLAAGAHNITITNWPGDNKSGALTLSVVKSTTYDTTVNFVDSHVVNLSSDALPVKLPQNTPVIFHINSDGTSGNLFVKKMNDRTLSATTVNINAEYVTGTNKVTAMMDLQLGSNIFHTDETTSSYFTVVTNTNSNYIGNVALLPNQAITQFAGVINDPNIDTTATQFLVADTTGIQVGASFIFNSSIITATFTVLYIDGNKIETQLYDAADLSADPIESWPDMIFTNPRFPGQPQLMNLIDAEPNTLVGSPGDLRGQVYANSDALYVAVTDFDNNTTNWAKFNSVGSAGASSGATPAVTNDSTTLATTAFVHNILPYGTIIMWHGTAATIPTGWALCNGANGTPNLVNMFIRGANADTALTSGGTDDAVIVQHNHSASSLVTDPGHFHLVGSDDLRGADPLGDSNSREGVYDWPGSPVGNTAITNTVGTGITVATTVNNNGVSGTGKNIPAYYALCYIMKTTG